MIKIRKIFSLLILATAPAILFAQVNPLDSYFEKYSSETGFYYLDLKTNMFQSSDDKSTNTGKDKMVSLKILSFEEGDNTKYNASKIYNDFVNSIEKANYRGLIEVKSSDENVEMMVKKEGNIIKEFIITIKEDKETTLVSATGNFDLKDLAKFSDTKNCKGLEVLKKLCEE